MSEIEDSTNPDFGLNAPERRRLEGSSLDYRGSGLGTDNGQNPGWRGAIQQSVTINLLVTFATDITSTQRQAVQIDTSSIPIGL